MEQWCFDPGNKIDNNAIEPDRGVTISDIYPKYFPPILKDLNNRV